MKLSTPVNKAVLKDHFTYNWWKYILAAVLSIFVWNMYYVQTMYHPPEDKRIDIYVQGLPVSQDELNSYFEPIWKKYVPEMETVETVTLFANTEQDYYSSMQIMTYIVAGQGDIYIIDGKTFKQYAPQGAFLPLEGFVESGKIDTKDIDLRNGYISYQYTEHTDDEEIKKSELHLYGIPLKDVPVSENLSGFGENLYLSVLYANNNEENVIKFVDGFIKENYRPDAKE